MAPPSIKSVSLKLVPLDVYQTLYTRLKSKYFDKLVEAWKTESTHPEKFIHEVIIFYASYLQRIKLLENLINIQQSH